VIISVFHNQKIYFLKEKGKKESLFKAEGDTHAKSRRRIKEGYVSGHVFMRLLFAGLSRG